MDFFDEEPEEYKDPRLERMEAMNELFEKISAPFSTVDDFAEMENQMFYLQLLAGHMALEMSWILQNLVSSIRDSVPERYHNDILKNYRTFLARTQQNMEQIRAKNMEERKRRMGEGWKDGESSEWQPGDDPPDEPEDWNS